MARRVGSSGRLDDAARAGWLYYVAGRTQDEIAAAMGISRQSAQRLVSLAVAEKLVKVRLDHPIAECMELAQAVKQKYDLRQVEVVPSDPGSETGNAGIAEAGAVELERWLKKTDPMIVAIGTGRTLRAIIDQLSPMECPQHRIVSLTGNISPDGSAAYYNVIFSMADAIKAQHFPMPMPVIVSSRAERDLLHQQALVRPTIALGAKADVTFVGIGEFNARAPLMLDGFLKPEEIEILSEAGVVGEICGWMFDEDGNLVESPVKERIASLPLPSRETSCVFGLARGRRKHAAIRAAVRGQQINALITDEDAARFLLEN
ncbi:sugar-binding transcriptional regulator [Rhizobium halophytocola]|uniref:DNA-binding transcriptional regulator LsrR (DeoR family) n=1 Tax=Rhizobium halophytocola TaxID=735519 RepID=A0ABS4DSU6_9HYPH|nr:sugar-binding transcriptional regulator [Rhizobium halophytocola]MBP1848759.1 DNA-binding transcriptional regulator LsrR (DeoR family) [Rhizobium halophytocola]